MSSILHLQDILEKKGNDFIYELFNKEVIINEKNNFSSFSFRKCSDNTFKFFKKDKEITNIDRIISKFYETPINYIENLPVEIKNKLPHNFIFGTGYSPDSSILPNNLLLNYIHVLNDQNDADYTIHDKKQLDYWSDTLGISKPRIIFQGKLTDKQKNQILEFIQTPVEQLKDKFKLQDFSTFIVKLLCKEIKIKDIRKFNELIFRFIGDNTENTILAKIVDPLFKQRKIENVQQESTDDYVYLIIIDLLNFIETLDFNKIFLGSEKFEDKYIEFCNYVFNEFINEYGEKYSSILINVPEFLRTDNFQININYIRDIGVINNLNKNDNYKEIYKILLNFFRKKRKKTSGKIFDKNILIQFNSLIDKINIFLRKNELYERYFPLFNEFVTSEIDDDLIKVNNYIEESIEINPVETKNVNILVGKFQPFHIGHLKSLELLKNKNGLPTIIICIKQDKNNDKFPFNKSAQEKIFNKVKDNHKDLIETVLYTKRGWIEDLLKLVRPTYEPILWGSGEDKIGSYKLQVEYAKNKKIDLNLNKDFKLYKLPKYTSSNLVRQYITENNYTEYKKLMPEFLHNEFPYLYREIQNASPKQGMFESTNIEAKYNILMESLTHLLNETENIEVWKNLINTKYSDLTEDQRFFYKNTLRKINE